MNKKVEELQEYRNNTAISQSELKKVLTNDTTPFDNKKKVHLMVGSLVDCLLTTPECLDEWFYISQITKYPKPQYKETFDRYYQMLVDNDLGIEFDNFSLLQIFREVSNVNTGDDKVIEALWKEEEYWNDLLIANGRQIVSQDYWNKCNVVAQSLLTNPITANYFKSDLFVEVDFQVPLYWTYTDLQEGWTEECKGLADIRIIDHHNKTIQFPDVKTTSDSLITWKKNVARKYRYDIQGAYYYYGACQWAKQHYPDYTVKLPCFIVENVNYPSKPRIFEMTLDDIFIGTYGCDREKSKLILDMDSNNNHLNVDWEMDRIQGWQDAMNILHQAKLLGLPDWDIDYHRNQGKSTLDLWL